MNTKNLTNDFQNTSLSSPINELPVNRSSVSASAASTKIITVNTNVTRHRNTESRLDDSFEMLQ